MSWYCEYANHNEAHKIYHDTEYGFPLIGKNKYCDERYLFELQSLELFQAGLSWDLILKKRKTIVSAFENFNVDIVAAYTKEDIKRLLHDPGIIRNKLKVNSIIENAKRIKKLRECNDGFSSWIAENHPLTREEWTKLFRKNFKFMGSEIVNEFLMCIGYLPGSHHEKCLTFKKIAKLNPPWMEAIEKNFNYKNKTRY